MELSVPRVRRLMDSAGMDQSGLASQAGLSKSYVSQLLSGNRVASAPAMAAIAEALGVTVGTIAVSLWTCPNCGARSPL